MRDSSESIWSVALISTSTRSPALHHCQHELLYVDGIPDLNIKANRLHMADETKQLLEESISSDFATACDLPCVDLLNGANDLVCFVMDKWRLEPG